VFLIDLIIADAGMHIQLNRDFVSCCMLMQTWTWVHFIKS